MKAGHRVDKLLAMAQWKQVCDAFHSAGCQTQQLVAVPGLEDMVFANNQVFAGRDKSGRPFVVPSRMKFASRQREVAHYVAWFKGRGYEVIDLQLRDDAFLEGHGDVLWFRNDFSSGAVWAGYGVRSSATGVRSLSAAMAERGIRVIPLELVDERFYHLDTCLAPLSNSAVLAFPQAFSETAWRRLCKEVERVHEASEEEALAFACNGVAVNGCFIVSRISQRLRRILKAEGLRTLEVNTSEFEKSGGSICCLKMLVDT